MLWERVVLYTTRKSQYQKNEKTSEDHRNNAHHNARLENVCELEADGVRKTELPLWYRHTRPLARKAPGFWVR